MADSAEKRGSLALTEAPMIGRRILVVRGRHVMLDEDLAGLYGVETRVLVQQVRRNEQRFPDDFMFQLSAAEFDNLKSQSVISSGGHGGRRKRPLAFTEHGVAMLSGVLRSDRAIAVNVEIMRAFIDLRRAASSYAALEVRLDKLEQGLGQHDEQLRQIFETLRQLIAQPSSTRRPVGFMPPDEGD